MHNTSLSRPATHPCPIPVPHTPTSLRECADSLMQDLCDAVRRAGLIAETLKPDRVTPASIDASLAAPSPAPLDPVVQRLISQRNQLFQETVSLAHQPLPMGHDPQRAHDKVDRLAEFVKLVCWSDEEVLGCLDPKDPETAQIRQDLASGVERLQDMVRLQRIAATEAELARLGVRFAPGSLGQLDLQACGPELPWNQLTSLIGLYVDGNNPADAELGAQMLARLAPRLVPGDPSTRELARKLVQLADELAPRLRPTDRCLLDGVLPLLLPFSREALSNAIHARAPAMQGRGTIGCVLQTLEAWPVVLHHLVADQDEAGDVQSNTHALLARLFVDEFREKVVPDTRGRPFCLPAQIDRIDQATAHHQTQCAPYLAERRSTAHNTLLCNILEHWEETTVAVDLLQFLADPLQPEGPAPGPDDQHPFLPAAGTRRIL